VLFCSPALCRAVLCWCADDDGNYLVMDGKQRLASLIAFYTGDERIGNLHWSA